MDTQTLLGFIAVAEEKSISGAAARLNLSSSTLAQQIRLLEEELDSVLFTYHPACILITAAGVAFLPHARGIVLEFELARSDIRRIEKITATENRVRAGAHSSIA